MASVVLPPALPLPSEDDQNRRKQATLLRERRAEQAARRKQALAFAAEAGDEGAAEELEQLQDEPPPTVHAAAVGTARDSSALSPNRIAVVVIAYNRPQYLDRALKSIFLHHPGGGTFPIFVSQDGENDAVGAMIAKYGARRLVHPRKVLKFKSGTCSPQVDTCWRRRVR